MEINIKDKAAYLTQDDYHYLFSLRGGIIGTFLFLHYQFDAFLLPILFLMIASFYNYFRFYIIRTIRRYK
jgi:hypothetical protein